MTLNSFTETSPADLLPHRGGMLLVEEIIEITKKYAITAATVKKNWPLTENGVTAPLVLIELAAQTAGVCNSWNDLAVRGNKGGNKGWVVGVKQAEFFIATIPVKSRIITRSENTHKYDVLREISSTIHMDNQLIGKVTLQLIKAEEND